VDIGQRDKAANELAKQGYCIVSDVLDTAMLAALRERFNDAELSATAKGNFGDSGVFIAPDYHDQTLIKLLTWPKTIQTLAALGFKHPKLHNFYVSAKPPKADALTWHSDLFYRYEKSKPAELFLIYYLRDTTHDNGCLRVVPKSHKWSHEKRHEQPEDANLRQDEVNVPVKAGQLFIGDRRIMHATHPNNGDTWRTCLTIAYAPLYDELDDPIKALIVQNRCLPPKGWWENPTKLDIDPRLQQLLPVYRGNVAPITIDH
jgi:ectoine hydroxylase-related dioxygenase (phytanoyl-CoA dioxygenase family)